MNSSTLTNATGAWARHETYADAARPKAPPPPSPRTTQVATCDFSSPTRPDAMALGRAPSAWSRLPAEIKLAVFEQLGNTGYVGLAHADRDNYALARGMSAWRWKQLQLRDDLAHAASFQDAADVLAAHAPAVRALRAPLLLPDDSPQFLLDLAHKGVQQSGQPATVLYTSMPHLCALERIPSCVQATLDLAYKGQAAAHAFLDTRRPEGLSALRLSGLNLGDYLGEGTHRVLGSTLQEAVIDDNYLDHTILVLPSDLKILSMAQNHLTALQVQRWRFPRHLDVLDLSENPLGAVPRNLPPNLRQLSLALTHLSGADLLGAALPQRLDMLVLYGNTISAEEENLLCARLPNTDILF